jgi:hypothetical protein
MRTAIALFACCLLAACGGEPATPATTALATATADPAAPRVVEDWPLPATLPGSALPDLRATDDGRLLMAWTNSQPGRRHVLQFSTWDVPTARWMTAPMPIAIGHAMFVNWADTPHLAATPDGMLWAHWLQKNGEDPYAYDVMLASSRDGGRRWSAPLAPHDDGTATEHGFVSMWAEPAGGLGLAWLDGRAMAATTPGDDGTDHAPADGGGHDARGGHGTADAGGAHDAHGHSGARMTLRAASVDAAMRVADAAVLDDSVCDCCQTDGAVTGSGAVVAYRARREGEIRDIHVVRRVDGAWTAPVPVHADGWVMPACPVNGPAIAASGQDVVVAWYTAPGDRPQVRVAASRDGGAAFDAPVVLDQGDAVHGRVDIALADGQAWVLWLREDREGQSLWLSRRSPDLATEYQRLQVARLAGRGRGTGFPRMAVAGGVAHVVWTDLIDGTATLRGARILAR